MTGVPSHGKVSYQEDEERTLNPPRGQEAKGFNGIRTRSELLRPTPQVETVFRVPTEKP